MPSWASPHNIGHHANFLSNTIRNNGRDGTPPGFPNNSAYASIADAAHTVGNLAVNAADFTLKH